MWFLLQVIDTISEEHEVNGTCDCHGVSYLHSLDEFWLFAMIADLLLDRSTKRSGLCWDGRGDISGWRQVSLACCEHAFDSLYGYQCLFDCELLRQTPKSVVALLPLLDNGLVSLRLFDSLY